MEFGESHPGILAAVSGFLGALLTGAFSLIMWRLQLPKFKAETEKLEAETDDITSVRLIRELDRLDVTNAHLAKVVDDQRIELDKLRREVLVYAAREMEHAAETSALRQRINELEGIETKSPLMQTLIAAYPPPIPHSKNEYDDDGPAGKTE